MGLRVGTLGRRSKRAGAVVLAAAIGALAPGVSPLTVGVPVASAQGAPTPEQGERAAWMPPPPSGPQPGDGGGRPPEDFNQATQCVSSGGGQQLGKDDILKTRPWGQDHLQLSKVHKYVEANSRERNVGGGIKVAVIDTGVTPHSFLEGRLSGGGDYVMIKPPGPGLEDCDGHGTEVAGIIAAKPNRPDVAFIGVAPDAHIISIRQTSQAYTVKDDEQRRREAADKKAKEDLKKAQDAAKKQAAEADARIKKAEEQARRAAEEAAKNKDGGGGSPSGSTYPGQDGDTGPRVQDGGKSAGDLGTLAQAVVRAADSGAKVINMSIDSCRLASTSITPLEKKLQNAIRYAVERKDAVVVAAAGNKSQACVQNGEPSQANPNPSMDPNKPTTIVTPPWFSEDLLAVAAIDKSGGVADFSMHGPWVSVAAPGTEIISLDPVKNSNRLANQMIEGGKPALIQGTSFAAPYVAGLAVLVRQMFPELNAREVMERIQQTAQHPGAKDSHDQFIGYGVIDPMAALTATLPQDIGLSPAQAVKLDSSMPGPGDTSNAPLIVALGGSAGAAAGLGIVLFAVHAVRRTRERNAALRG